MARRSRFYYKTESLSSYTRRIAEITPSVSRRLVVRAEDRMQAHIRRRTPKVTSTLYNSIRTQHEGRWESVRRTVGMSYEDIEAARSHNAFHTGLNYLMTRSTAMKPAGPADTYEGSVYSDVEYAPYVEYDTGRYGPNPGDEGRGRYAIVPRRSKVLVFVIDGRVIFTTKVRHPGSRGKHMFSRGAAFVGREGYLHNQSRDILAKWRAAGSLVGPVSAPIR